MAAKKKKKKLAAKAAPKKKLVAKKKVVAKKKKVAAPKKKAAAPKKKAAAPKKKAAPKKVAPKKKPVRRRDRAGHIDPTYGKQLRAKSGKNARKEQTMPAFKVSDDDVAEDMGEEVVGKATTGEDAGEDVANAEYDEEVGGPFVVTSGSEEFAEGTDESNPPDADREPFPKT